MGAGSASEDVEQATIAALQFAQHHDGIVCLHAVGNKGSNLVALRDVLVLASELIPKTAYLFVLQSNDLAQLLLALLHLLNGAV